MYHHTQQGFLLLLLLFVCFLRNCCLKWVQIPEFKSSSSLSLLRGRTTDTCHHTWWSPARVLWIIFRVFIMSNVTHRPCKQLLCCTVAEGIMTRTQCNFFLTPEFMKTEGQLYLHICIKFTFQECSETTLCLWKKMENIGNSLMSDHN